MAEQPPKRKRVVPIPIAPSGAGETNLNPAVNLQTSAAARAPVEYHRGPSTLPGRRMKADISESNTLYVNYKQLLKQNGLDTKELKARQNEAEASKSGKASDGLPNLPGLPRAGASPGGGGKAMFASVVDRLERIYTAGHNAEEDDEDEGEEGESDDEQSVTSEADASGDSSSSSDSSDEEMGGPSGEQAEPGPGAGGGNTAAAKGAAAAAGTDATAAAASAGTASDGAGPGAKKPRLRRRPSILAYEEDFIDDADELEYAKKRRAKPKYQGFIVIQGAVEVEGNPEEEEEQQRQAQRRAPRPRPPPGAQTAKAKSQAAQVTQPTGAAAGAAAAATAAAGGAGGGPESGAPPQTNVSTPVRGGGKRRAEGDNPLPAGKKRKQPQPEAAASGPRSPGPASAVPPAAAPAAAAAQQPNQRAVPSGSAAPQGLAALAASMGRSAGATAAAATGADVAAATGAAGAAAAAAQPPLTEAMTTGAHPPPAVEAGAEPGGPSRLSGRRNPVNHTTLESTIAECTKKLGAAASPPSDWAALLKLIDAPLTQVALYLHRKHGKDAAKSDADLSVVSKALAEAAPAIAGPGPSTHSAPPGPPGELRDFLQRRVTRSTNELARMVAKVKKLAADFARAEAGAGGAGAAGHSSDDESAEPAGVAPAAAAVLEPLDAKLRSYLNLYRKMYECGDDSEVLNVLAEQVGVDISVLQRALRITQNRPAGQQKRQGSKATAAGASTDEVLRQQAAAIALEVNRAVAEGQGLAAAPSGLAPTAGSAGAPGPATTAAAVGAATATTAQQAGQLAPGSLPASAAAEASGAEAVNAAAASQPEGTQAESHKLQQFPSSTDDAQQRKDCKEELKKCSGASEELLARAFDAAASSEWSNLAIKVLCHCKEGMGINELAKRAEELRYIFWPPHKPRADLYRQLRQAVNRASMGPHILHVGNNRYVLQAMQPDAKAVPRPPPARGLAGGGGGSANSSPAGPALPANAAAPGGGVSGGAFAAAAGEPVPFPQLQAVQSAPPVPAGQEAGAAQPPSAAAPLSGGAADAGAGVGGDGMAVAASGVAAAEDELTADEDQQQCDVCVAAAVKAGADERRVLDTLSKLKARNVRIVFKVLCHAGPAGMRVADIVRFAREHRFVNWPDTADRTSSVHGAIRSSKELVVHVGSHQYALVLFPEVVPMPKSDTRRGARGGAAGGGGGGGVPSGNAPAEGAGGEGGE